jgi:hypothetical protein
MAARGTESKEWITKKIIECFGQDKAFVHDKKLYITTKENGEEVQICLTMTCPKTVVSPDGVSTFVEPPKSAFGGGFDFESMGLTAPTAPEPFKPAEITNSERELVQDLMKRLGL